MDCPWSSLLSGDYFINAEHVHIQLSACMTKTNVNSLTDSILQQNPNLIKQYESSSASGSSSLFGLLGGLLESIFRRTRITATDISISLVNDDQHPIASLVIHQFELNPKSQNETENIREMNFAEIQLSVHNQGENMVLLQSQKTISILVKEKLNDSPQSSMYATASESFFQPGPEYDILINVQLPTIALILSNTALSLLSCIWKSMTPTMESPPVYTAPELLFPGGFIPNPKFVYDTETVPKPPKRFLLNVTLKQFHCVFTDCHEPYILSALLSDDPLSLISRINTPLILLMANDMKIENWGRQLTGASVCLADYRFFVLTPDRHFQLLSTLGDDPALSFDFVSHPPNTSPTLNMYMKSLLVDLNPLPLNHLFQLIYSIKSSFSSSNSTAKRLLFGELLIENLIVKFHQRNDYKNELSIKSIRATMSKNIKDLNQWSSTIHVEFREALMTLYDTELHKLGNM